MNNQNRSAGVASAFLRTLGRPIDGRFRISLRSVLFAVTAFAVYCGIFVARIQIPEPYESLEGVLGLISLMLLLTVVCVTSASIGQDVWQTPEATFVAGLGGLLCFSALLASGLMASVFVG